MLHQDRGPTLRPWDRALTFAALGIPRPSAAGVLSIDFDLSPSGLGAPGPEAPFPVRSGFATLTITDVDVTGRFPGPSSVGMISNFRIGLDAPQPMGSIIRVD